MLQRLLPIGPGYANAWSSFAGAASAWQTLISDDGASSYVEQSGGGSANAAFFEMGPIPTVAEVVSVTLGAKGSLITNAQPPGDTEACIFYTRTVANGNLSAAQHNVVSPATTGFVLTSGVAPRPGTGAWIPGDLTGIQAGATFPHGAVVSGYRMSYLYLDLDYVPPAGGFVCLVGSLAGAALGLAEMANLAKAVYARTRSLILPREYEIAWREIRAHRWAKTFDMHVAGAGRA